MDFNDFLVTWKTNVKEFKNDDGEKDFLLIDEEVFGHIVSVHMAQMTSIVEMPIPDSTTGELAPVVQVAVVPKIGVLWDNERSPAPAYTDPEKLYWFPNVGDDEEEEEEVETLEGDEFSDVGVIEVQSKSRDL